jgi:hypothetical protein
MILALAIGIPVFLIFGGALLALAFTGVYDEQDAARHEARPGEHSRLFIPSPAQPKAGPSRLTVEELITAVEGHLRDETAATQAFVQRPSVQSLWLDRQSLN